MHFEGQLDILERSKSGVVMSNDDPQRQPQVMEFVPKGRSIFNWKVVSLLLLLWAAVVVGTIFLKAPLLRIIWPIIVLVLIGYLLICTVVALRRR